MTAAPPTTECPYIGLRYFEERDAELFYGRDEHIAELLAKLSSNRFVAVLGSSVSGKSSLVRAGLLPELRAGMIPQAGPRWKVLGFQPKNAPMSELARSLQETLAIANAYDVITEGPLGLVNAIHAARLDQRTNVLVIADQFEEVFRFQREAREQNKQAAAEECHSLVRRLLDAAASELSIYVLIVMRSDYLGHCSQFPDLPERISESLYLLPRLRRDQLEQAIVTPAGGDIEPALVQRFLSDAGADQDQLPLLQHLLMRLWMAHRLTTDGYKDLGGYQGALSDHLNQIYNDLTANQQKVCEPIFQRLSDRDENNRDVRRRPPSGN